MNTIPENKIKRGRKVTQTIKSTKSIRSRRHTKQNRKGVFKATYTRTSIKIPKTHKNWIITQRLAKGTTI